MRIQSHSVAFGLLLGLLSALPTFGIDMMLPGLPAIAADFGVVPAHASLAIGAYLVTPGPALLVYGPLSDRFGRKPIIVFGCILLIAASVGCVLSRSLAHFLVFRALQGAGASATGMAALAIVGDSFDGVAARARMSNVVFAINIVRMLGPTIGAALLAVRGWRTICVMPIAAGLLLLALMRIFGESAKMDSRVRLNAVTIARNYIAVFRHPVCRGAILCNAAMAGAAYAYMTGSSLFFISALRMGVHQYGLIVGASSASVLSGTLVGKRLGSHGVSSDQSIAIGLACAALPAAWLLVTTVLGGASVGVVVLTIAGVGLSVGLISPNAMSEALQPLPQIGGSVVAAMTFVQMIASALSTALVAMFFDGRSAFSMAMTTFSFCAVAIIAFVGPMRRTSTRVATSLSASGPGYSD